MAAYAGLASLMNTIDGIQIHPRLSISLDKKQTESLVETTRFLLDFIESAIHSHGGSKEEEQVLESQIASASFAAEDVIKSHAVDQIRSGSISSLDLQTVIEGMDFVKDKAVGFSDKRGLKDQHPTYSTPAIFITGKSKMIGFDDELTQLMERLTGQHRSLQIIPIVGMGGIGKTTLARNLYESQLIVHHFDICAWTTISQEYSAIDIFSKLLSCQSKSTTELDRETSEVQLAQRLYQSLIGRRYLIVLDDIWSIKAWEKIMFFFPDNNNGSRIVLTTRLANVAIHFGPSYLSLKFLEEDKSWKLFCQKAFPQEGCPPQLEKIGKNIAKNCKGLPLLIVVIGGLLRKSSTTQELWENISKDINLIPNLKEEEQNLDILSLSYSHLPAHLKACFLYTGIFSNDQDTHAPQLLKLWVAEGFIRPNKTQTLEEIAEGYLNDLIDRNLILLRSRGSNKKIRSCDIHNLLRDFCLKLAKKEKFINVLRGCDISKGVEANECRIVFHREILENNYDGLLQTLESSKFKMFRGLKVVDSDSSLDDILKQVNLCYVSTPFLWISSGLRHISSSISLLWNLQMLVVKDCGTIIAPPEIWEMPQLRHIQFGLIILPNPPLSVKQDCVVLRNLQTLKGVENLKFGDEVCKRIPNVKKLKIVYDEFSIDAYDFCLYNLGSFRKLESLNCFFSSDLHMQDLKFPSSIKKLTLEGCCLNWEDLTMVGSLSNLEVLKLGPGSVVGPVWDPVEGEFLLLKYLAIHRCDDLRHWNAYSCHFPVLENLVLEGMSELEEIPFGVGELPTLGSINLIGCSDSAAVSAVEILEEQESVGNEGLCVRIDLWKKKDLKRLRKMVEHFDCFASINFKMHVIKLDDLW
ncbi:hypothetical protein ABFS83_04G168900 [Erythranthe nasuta]